MTRNTGQRAAAPPRPRRSDDEHIILASWTLHDVLRRYPQLLEALIGLSPDFGKLRNPVLRRVQTRLVTVAQAAAIAGLEPAAVVRRLNAAAGQESPAEAVTETPPPPVAPASVADTDAAAAFGAPVAVDLDVRPLLARGEEPFRAIMTAARDIPVGQALRLHVGFEPLPLYDMLAKRGFRHRAEPLGPDGWAITFVRLDAGGTNADAGSGEHAAAPARHMAPPGEQAGVPGTVDATVQIDVSDLVPPEPMVRILEALAQLAPGQTLLVEHVRRPVYLYPQLDAQGYQHTTDELGPGRVQLRIRKPATFGGAAE
jgi:uncharacterized protein (DUF2249 family)